MACDQRSGVNFKNIWHRRFITCVENKNNIIIQGRDKNSANIDSQCYWYRGCKITSIITWKAEVIEFTTKIK